MKNSVFYWLFGSLFVLGSCMESSDQVRVSKIRDLKRSDEALWNLEYDDRGRLTAYGDTPIQYDKDEIRIGRMNWDYGGEQLLSATYFLSDGEVSRSNALCLLVTDTAKLEVQKEVDYLWCGDTIKMESNYWSVSDNSFVKQILSEYVYDDEGSLVEIISCYTGAGRQTSTCHSYYNYDNNVSCNSNLSLRSFFVNAEGADAFFFFLLNMDRKLDVGKLPTRIRYCVNHGEAVYMADGLYKLDDKLLVRGEVISDDIKLKARLDFEYTE